ncbi:jerky protein homolog-like [Bombus affinis]|uniref:jerky protein homolog-like n=1 Tax=Bombus affinis TaxID=309941 RepID=UPI0021B815CF|nr:jerky protein homolog-like [Bombus affinis]
MPPKRKMLTVIKKCEVLEMIDKERLLRQWYIRCIAKGIKLTGTIISEKAQELNKQLKKNSTFTASLRWVANFRERHNLRKEDMKKNLKIPNEAAVDTFKAEFNKFMQKEGYKLENVYNTDSTTLMWKTASKNTLSQSSRRLYKKQVTIFLCTNATGCHKPPILIVETIKKTQTTSSSYTSDPPIMYITSKKHYIESDTFNEWFYECFLKSVTERQQRNGHREKTLLLLNNAGLDHESTIISTRDEFVKIMHFSYDAAPLIQPMDHGIIACFKRMYRKELLVSLMKKCKKISDKEFKRIYSRLNKNDFCRMVYNAWLKVENPIIKNAWDKLLKNESQQSSERSEIIKKNIELGKLNRLPGYGECSSTSVMNWFETDKEHNTGTQDDIQNTLLDFINTVMDTGTNELIDENFEDILYGSSP